MTSSTSGSECSKYEAKIESGRVAKYDYDTAAAGAKSCAGKVPAADLTQYVWDYKNDENKDLGLEVGAVVHNREWSYGLIKYASLVQVAVSFKAKCTFSFRDEGTTRTLKIVDDTGYTHGELDINIHAGTPCVCAASHRRCRPPWHPARVATSGGCAETRGRCDATRSTQHGQLCLASPWAS